MEGRAAKIPENARGRLWLSLSGLLAMFLAVGPSEPEDPCVLPARSLPERTADLERERDRLLVRVAQLEAELGAEREQRLEREREWLRYTLAVAALQPEAQKSLPVFGPHVPGVEADVGQGPRDPTPQQRAAQRRSAQVLANLRALLAAEGVRGLDLLEAGLLGEGATGPVVFRLLDDVGRLAGSLFAERLRLEASRAGRTLSLVLEEGYESIGGERIPFGSRAQAGLTPPWRLTLCDIDPQPWIEELPELFGAAPKEVLPDDGRWDLAWVQVKLNELLRLETSAGWYRLRRLGGVENDVLRDVHVEVLSQDGALERRLFADRLRLEPTSRGVVLAFEDGVLLRGGQKTPFLQGRHRVFLPRARVELWRDAGLPGFAATPRRGAAARR